MQPETPEAREPGPDQKCPHWPLPPASHRSYPPLHQGPLPPMCPLLAWQTDPEQLIQTLSRSAIPGCGKGLSIQQPLDLGKYLLCAH